MPIQPFYNPRPVISALPETRSMANAVTTAAAGKPRETGGLSFGDLLDVINPLHHIPVIGAIYRKLSGDDIAPGRSHCRGRAVRRPAGRVGFGGECPDRTSQRTRHRRARDRHGNGESRNGRLPNTISRSPALKLQTRRTPLWYRKKRFVHHCLSMLISFGRITGSTMTSCPSPPKYPPNGRGAGL